MELNPRKFPHLLPDFRQLENMIFFSFIPPPEFGTFKLKKYIRTVVVRGPDAPRAQCTPLTESPKNETSSLQCGTLSYLSLERVFL